MELPQAWTAFTADTERDEKKRVASPASFFFCQGQAICLAASYFKGDRLVATARGGVARKHRLRIDLALFGQLMASFEYMLKDFIARVLDLTDIYDEKVKGAAWVEINVERVLAIRTANMSAGAMLIHPTMRWHDPDATNNRYGYFFGDSLLKPGEIEQLNLLWILRHSVAHNAGYVTAPDAARLGAAGLANKVAAIDDEFVRSAFDALKPIAKRLAEEVGRKVQLEWMRLRLPDEDFARDRGRYELFLHLASFVESRTTELPAPDQAQYSADFQAAHAAPPV